MKQKANRENTTARPQATRFSTVFLLRAAPKSKSLVSVGMKARLLAPCAIGMAANIFLSLSISPSRAAADFIGPTPYLSQADSPLAAGIAAGTTTLQDFEHGFTNGIDVTASTGIISYGGPYTDSVDADDGLIDGSGLAGHSWYVENGPTGVTFTFDAERLGGLPTHVGIVWADGRQSAEVTFEAFGLNSNSLGTVVATLGDNSIHGTTAEDRFFGVMDPSGISAILIKSVGGTPIGGTGAGLEVDHLQYGRNLPLTNALVTTIQIACVDVCWNTQSNRLYQPQYKSELTTNTWVDLGLPILGDGATNCITDSIRGQPHRFYRVTVLP